MGTQQTLMAAQSVLPPADVPTDTALMQLSQVFGGPPFVRVAQNMVTTPLASGLSGIGGVDPAAVVNTGATDITSVFQHDPDVLHSVRACL